MIPDWLKLDVMARGLQQPGRAADRQFADAACTQPTAYDDTLRVPPLLDAEDPARDDGKLLGELLNRTKNDASGYRVAGQDDAVKLLLANRLAADGTDRIAVVALARTLASIL